MFVVVLVEPALQGESLTTTQQVNEVVGPFEQEEAAENWVLGMQEHEANGRIIFMIEPVMPPPPSKMMMTNFTNQLELAERAWSALAATGRDIDDGWMLMAALPDDSIPGGYRFEFKNHYLPFMLSDPAYDGRRKTIHLPKGAS